MSSVNDDEKAKKSFSLSLSPSRRKSGKFTIELQTQNARENKENRNGQRGYFLFEIARAQESSGSLSLPRFAVYETQMLSSGLATHRVAFSCT